MTGGRDVDRGAVAGGGGLRLSLATVVAIPGAVVAKVLLKELWSRRLTEGPRAPMSPG